MLYSTTIAASTTLTSTSTSPTTSTTYTNMTIDIIERDIIIMPNKTRPPGLPNRIPASSMRASTQAPKSLVIFWD
jgi:hypothetical protein